MVYAYFGGLGADKHSTFELLLEQRGALYTVTAIRTPLQPAHDTIARHTPWHWFRRATSSVVGRQIHQGQDGRIALRTLFWAARAANLADHGQRYCYVLPSVPAKASTLAPLISGQLRFDGSLPIHPQLWQVGRSLDTLPVERHHQACTDGSCIVKLTTGERSLDEGYFR